MIDFSRPDTLAANIVDAVLGDEGGYSNNSDDRGGETNWGITAQLLKSYAHEAGTMVVKDLTREGAIKVYIAEFWNARGIGKLAAAGFPRLAYTIMDFAVNSGPDMAVESMQAGLNLLNNQAKRWSEIPEDGTVGPRTLATLAAAKDSFGDAEHILCEWVNASRIVFMGMLARKRQSQEKFMLGWLRRVLGVELEVAA